jgi:hypothetical protein
MGNNVHEIVCRSSGESHGVAVDVPLVDLPPNVVSAVEVHYRTWANPGVDQPFLRLEARTDGLLDLAVVPEVGGMVHVTEMTLSIPLALALADELRKKASALDTLGLRGKVPGVDR